MSCVPYQRSAMTGFFSRAKTEEEARGWIFSLARCTEICIFRQLLVSFLVSKNDAPCAGGTMMSHALREAAVTQTHNTSQPWPALRKTFCKMIIKPRNYFHVQWYECKHQLASSWRSFLTLIVSFCPSVFLILTAAALQAASPWARLPPCWGHRPCSC